MVADEGEIVRGTGPELVVEVGDDECEAMVFAQGEQEVEAGEGIGAAGDGDEETGAPMEEALGGGKPFDGLESGGEGGTLSGGRAAATMARRAAPAGRRAG